MKPRRETRLFSSFFTFLFCVLVGIGTMASCTQPTQPVIEITPPVGTLVSGQTLQLTVTRRFPGGPVEVVTDRVTYTSSNRNAGTATDRGLLTAGSEASSVIIRVSDPQSEAIASASFVISAPRIDSIEITPSPAVVLRPGEGRHFAATAHLNNGLTKDVTANVLWSSSNEAAATVGRMPTDYGLVTAIAEGDTTISATDAATLVQGRSIVFVRGDAPGLVALVVKPNPATVAVNATVQLTADGIFTDGTTKDLTKIVTWSSSNFATATIDPNGLVKGLALGDVTITALGASGTVKGSSALKVQ